MLHCCCTDRKYSLERTQVRVQSRRPTDEHSLQQLEDYISEDWASTQTWVWLNAQKINGKLFFPFVREIIGRREFELWEIKVFSFITFNKQKKNHILLQMLIVEALNNKTPLKYYLCDCFSAIVCWPGGSGATHTKLSLHHICFSKGLRVGLKNYKEIKWSQNIPKISTAMTTKNQAHRDAKRQSITQ